MCTVSCMSRLQQEYVTIGGYVNTFMRPTQDSNQDGITYVIIRIVLTLSDVKNDRKNINIFEKDDKNQ